MYFDSSPSGQEGEIETKLTLAENGRFVFEEDWVTYAFRTGGELTGRWEQMADGLTLHVEASTLDRMKDVKELRISPATDGDAFVMEGGVRLGRLR